MDLENNQRDKRVTLIYTLKDVQDIIERSCTELREKQPILFDKNSDINERTVSGELAGILRQYIMDFHVNCEYNRMTDENGLQMPKRIGLNPNHSKPSIVYPDIIVHRQEDGKHNLLIIEIKMNWKNNNKENDLVKIYKYMKELHYQFGLYLELGQEGISMMKWYKN